MYAIIKTVTGIPAICLVRGTWIEAMDCAVSLVRETYPQPENFIREGLDVDTHYEYYDSRVDILEVQ